MKLFGLNSIVLKSFAKINLALHVKGVRDDRYHFLDSIILPISVHDVVEVEINKYSKTTTVVCDLPLLQRNHHNICQRAVEAMRAHYGFSENFEIKIHKVIPVAAGMGGGSSNAACVLNAVNKLLELGASEDELRKIAIEVGADVPFFINPKPVRLIGVGDALTPIELNHDYNILLVAPTKGLLTKDVYTAFDHLKTSTGDCDQLVQMLKDGDDENISKEIINDLYPAAVSLMPELEKHMERVRNLNLPIVSMTGSGSAIFAISPDKKAIRKAELILSEEGYRVCSGKVGHLKKLIK